MEERCYLLSVEQLYEEGGEALFAAALERVDASRRERAERMRPGAARAAGVGAGLLLQAALREMPGIGSAAVNLQEESVQEESGQNELVQTGSDPKREEGEVQKESGPQPTGQSPGSAKRNTSWKSGKALEQCGYKGGREFHGLREYTVEEILQLVSAPLELGLKYGKKGKPYLRDCPVFFNLSHSGDYVCCAVSGREVGVDIQRCSMQDMESLQRIARRFFSGAENDALERCREEERQQLFYRLWARKEAWGKLTGEGILAAVSVNFLPCGPMEFRQGQPVQERFRDTGGGALDLVFQEWQYPKGYWIALCRENNRP